VETQNWTLQNGIPNGQAELTLNKEGEYTISSSSTLQNTFILEDDMTIGLDSQFGMDGLMLSCWAHGTL
jgi:hypothetical protein